MGALQQLQDPVAARPVSRSGARRDAAALHRTPQVPPSLPSALLTLWLLYVALMLGPGVNQLLVSQFAARLASRPRASGSALVMAGLGLSLLVAALNLIHSWS